MMQTGFRVILVIVSFMTVAFMMRKIRQAKLQIEAAIFWVLLAAVLFAFAVFPPLADFCAQVLGIYSTLNRLVGLLEISQINPQVESVTLSFILGQEYTGQGYASAAVRATTEYLFRTVGVRRIQCFVLPINYRAVLVLERCGFVKEGTIREGFYWPDKGIVDLTVYSLLPTDKKPKSTGPAYYL